MHQASVDLWTEAEPPAEEGAPSQDDQYAQPNPHVQEVNGEQYYDEMGQQPVDANNMQEQYYEEGYNEEGYYEEEIPDVLLLQYHCRNAIRPQDNSDLAVQMADKSWEPVREWMSTHSSEEVRAAAEQKDDAGRTALHFVCQLQPPIDIVSVFTSVAIGVTKWTDNFDWLPIHYACAYAASAEVIKALAEAFPESRTLTNPKGHTPLHLLLGTSDERKASAGSWNPASTVLVLCSTGAAKYADVNGMLPLHYACAYGASEECLYILTDTYSAAISTTDRQGRTPLHFALANAGKPSAPSAVRLLLGLNKNLVNSIGGGQLPLRVLSEFASAKHSQADRLGSETCLKLLLGANPEPTADFFTALQGLPGYLQEIAVVLPSVQELLNVKIAQRFPTMILVLDFYAQMLIVGFYSFTIGGEEQSLEQRFFNTTIGDDGQLLDEPKLVPTIDMKYLIPLYVGASYFLLREVIQILSLFSLGAITNWILDPNNWLNFIYVGLVYFWAIVMTNGSLEKEFFRTGSAVSILFIWIKFLGFLRNVLIDFAVFIGGVFHVIRRLVAFLLCLAIILLAFSQMFTTLFQGTEYCEPENDPRNTTEFLEMRQCEENDVRPWCDRWDAFLSVYTMLLGEVDEDLFEDNTLALILFIFFMFLVVILLANVLIAIVTDSYKVIQDQRAAIVFWTNRLNFIAQMDAIANGPWKAALRELVGMEPQEKNAHSSGMTSNFGKGFWKRLSVLFVEEMDESSNYLEYIFYGLMRVLVLCTVAPAWIAVGFLTAGWLWPPQIRDFFFTSKIIKHNNEVEKEEELRKNQMEKMQTELFTMADELRQELALGRTQVVQTKSLIAERKAEIQAEMRHIKRTVTMLFEQQSGL